MSNTARQQNLLEDIAQIKRELKRARSKAMRVRYERELAEKEAQLLSARG